MEVPDARKMYRLPSVAVSIAVNSYNTGKTVQVDCSFVNRKLNLSLKGLNKITVFNLTGFLKASCNISKATHMIN